MHLRAPSIDQGVQSFIWAVVFFLVVFFGMVLMAIGKGTALIVGLSVAIVVFVLVRVRGENEHT